MELVALISDSDSITDALAMASFPLSILALWLSHRHSTHSAEFGGAAEFNNMLLDMDKELMRDPELWVIYDDHEMSKAITPSPALNAKLEALAYYMLNLLEFVFFSYHAKFWPREGEKKQYLAWMGWGKVGIRRSRRIREIICDSRFDNMYEPAFVSEVRQMLRDLQKPTE